MAGNVPKGHTIIWINPSTIASQRYQCGYCGQPLASEKGWTANSSYDQKPAAYICICHFCQRPTFIDERDRQFPGTTFGDPVQDVDDKDVAMLYEEARQSIGASAFTAAVLCCRKLLMHIAVAKGAPAGQSFLTYVEYLAEKNYIPPDAKGWVDHIRTSSNEANHEIVIMPREDAEELVTFSEMLLKVIYQFPAAIRKRSGQSGPAA
jgi:hypothetical protein